MIISILWQLLSLSALASMYKASSWESARFLHVCTLILWCLLKYELTVKLWIATNSIGNYLYCLVGEYLWILLIYGSKRYNPFLYWGVYLIEYDISWGIIICWFYLNFICISGTFCCMTFQKAYSFLLFLHVPRTPILPLFNSPVPILPNLCNTAFYVTFL